MFESSFAKQDSIINMFMLESLKIYAQQKEFQSFYSHDCLDKNFVYELCMPDT